MNTDNASLEPTPSDGQARAGAEERVLEICAAVLGVHDISIQDNFVELGGDSISAALVLNRVRALFQVSLPFSVLLGQRTTLAEVTQAIQHWRVASKL
jgi:acyl carrier protein